ncbi:PVC-type heme-binding CxxCH protein [Flavihumibacter profundi]|uniref:PVC-type heme-binding CxxCH protein n=1 Tax=Flavihumibacter profundi TaxID=2716883 RepID=UPI001CC81BFF|nr:PVC-type heme-binding CxxCH protein [Flavihumibacter profundi]MBZ5859346.1 c-type cytochrome [Flavihumibacter profundi]
MKIKWVSIAVLVIFCAVLSQCSSPSVAIEKPQLYLPDDLEATLWAESPMLYNPTNMDADSKGRIWVTEAVNYRNFNNDSTKFLHHIPGDRVMILEDTNNDGKADTAKVFVQDRDLVSPVGIAVIGNKVIVSCSPNLIIYTDEDGDDKPDKKEIILTGFGGKDHDHSLHSVTAGPDGKWYFNVGNAGPHTVTDKSGWTLRSGSLYTGGSPYNTVNEGNRKSDDGRVWVGGLALRINPDGSALKVLGHNFRNSYEVVTDSYGNLWQNDNDDQVVTCRTTWLMEGGNAGYFSSDGTRYWQADQRPDQDIFTAHWHQDDPGIMPAGDRSGAGAPTGIVRYESDALGDKYLGILFSADAGRNVVFGYHPTLKWSGYDLGKRENFVTSLTDDNVGYVWNDTTENARKEKWFRPSDVTIGTDGAMYIADWYDPVVGGHQMKDSIGYGRIYRITPKNKKLSNPIIDFKTIEGQVSALKNPAVNVRNIAFEQVKKQGPAAIAPVKKLLQDKNPFVQARAVWLLSQMGAPGRNEVVQVLNSPDELLRATAFRALRQVSDSMMLYAKQLSKDTSAFVRREVAIALRDLPLAEKKEILLSLAEQYDGNDRWYLEALGSAMDADAATWYTELKRITGENTSPLQWNKAMADFAWRLHPVNSIPDIVERARDTALPSAERKKMITALAFINDKKAVGEMINLAKSTRTEDKEQALYWVAFRQSNDWFPLINWSAVHLNTAYERKLAAMKVNRRIILDENQSKDERSWRAGEMAGDSIGAQLLIGLMAENKFPALLLPAVQERIFKNPDLSIRVQAGKYLKRSGADKIFSIDSITKMPGDTAGGRMVFVNKCSTCHRVGVTGNSIGPELTGIAKKFDKVALLDAIINPSAAIVFGYEPWLVNTKDGESVFGFLISENKQNLVIKDIAGNKHVFTKDKISSKEKQEKSLMPDPATLALTEKNLADIVAFLSAVKKQNRE